MVRSDSRVEDGPLGTHARVDYRHVDRLLGEPVRYVVENHRSAAHVMGRYAVVAPPLSLAPPFIVAVLLYYWEPFPHVGEWIELMLGLALLFTAAHWVEVQRFESHDAATSG